MKIKKGFATAKKTQPIPNIPPMLSEWEEKENTKTGETISALHPLKENKIAIGVRLIAGKLRSFLNNYQKRGRESSSSSASAERIQ